MSKEQTSIRLPDKLKEALEQRAKKEGRDLSNMIREILIQDMEKKTGKDFR